MVRRIEAFSGPYHFYLKEIYILKGFIFCAGLHPVLRIKAQKLLG
ncbi:hypothetical protein ADINL_0098 [Nitrincola lacisaponensis]|uniref:Uncharacterized protein n=1 Tax=Nitrincola lacisaponensis TaxID=267850 RepID=A0A063Y526_9GAMM|nr:hypothetical protein ADINL_0098 [Nitrincola lacisaponensis]